ncbi:UDP-N-acetylmuramate dehydrogenase [Marinobacter lacisalsi]|uniref:UDP-N-acetylenolpyruvoylglucosamine reductase n=1 Tax=Marinobacter lacisalsi TaxID=475979 RepID=A0ABV8QJ81_9GAMM
MSRWRIGGLADVVVEPASLEELVKLRRWLNVQKLPHVFIGSTSNLLFSDRGLKVICVRLGERLAGYSVEGTRVSAEAGIWVPGLARIVMKAGLTGIEHTCGIPGTLGGLVCMNGGSLRNGIGDVIDKVTSVAADGSVKVRNRQQCAFSYRSSVFQTTDEVVASATVQLTPGELSTIRRTMLRILAQRRRKFPLKQPNCGSVFVSDPAMYDRFGPPGKIMEDLGFKGVACGGAAVAESHGNFIVNRHQARAEDVLSLIRDMKQAARDRTGEDLKVETIALDEFGQRIVI